MKVDRMSDYEDTRWGFHVDWRVMTQIHLHLYGITYNAHFIFLLFTVAIFENIGS